MKKVRLIYAGLCTIILFTPITTVSANDDMFSQLKNNYQTSSLNYGNIGDANVSVGYKTYLSNVSTSTSVLDSQLKDLNEYKQTLEIYKNFQKDYQDALTQKDDISEKTLKDYENLKNTAEKELKYYEENGKKTMNDKKTESQNLLSETQLQQATDFNNFQKEVANLKTEISNQKSTITAEAQKVAATRYNSVADGYSAAVKKVSAGNVSKSTYNKIANSMASSYKSYVNTFEKEYASEASQNSFAKKSPSKNTNKTSATTGRTYGGHKMNTLTKKSLVDENINGFVKGIKSLF